MSRKKKATRITTDALEIIDQRYFRGRPEREEALAEAQLHAEIAQRIYAMRKRAGLTQRQLASLIGTSASVISRLESADYDAHSLTMLQRISAALRHRVRVQFIPLAATARSRKVPA
jgi:ribosome-binding protein aMBF1 (putative translation factor)